MTSNVLRILYVIYIWSMRKSFKTSTPKSRYVCTWNLTLTFEIDRTVFLRQILRPLRPYLHSCVFKRAFSPGSRHIFTLRELISAMLPNEIKNAIWGMAHEHSPGCRTNVQAPIELPEICELARYPTTDTQLMYRNIIITGI